MKIIGKISKNLRFKYNLDILNFSNNPYKKEIFDNLKKLKWDLKGCEAYSLYVTVRNLCEKYRGNLAEVGVCEGDSAHIICEAKGNNPLYLFDNFNGLPKPTIEDENQFKGGESKAEELMVKIRLRNYNHVIIKKGLFPIAVGRKVEDSKFMFVNIDVDLYKSTLDCLEFFYPRMVAGGIIMSHDYVGLTGGKKAFDEFFKDKPEIIIELMGSQCLVVKGAGE